MPTLCPHCVHAVPTLCPHCAHTSPITVPTLCPHVTYQTPQISLQSSCDGVNNRVRGVPQGSTLGPALFNQSVRALPSCTITSKVRQQFADDVSMYKAGTNLQKLTDDLSADISVIREYLRDRGLNLNDSKTQFTIIRQKKQNMFLLTSAFGSAMSSYPQNQR